MSVDLTAATRRRTPAAKPAKVTAPAGESTAARLLPDDGIVDPIAIEIAASGVRPVALTHTERVLAAARILACGGSQATITARLHVPAKTARTLTAQARRIGDPGDLWAA
ncbi:hypothetical protein ACFQY7_16170 [Actinomadura luteofluorescens]|uniref:hypothetical protein n=1 Tax=Actinomadura luteofluorescens TaxID=46163 RepID=UPI0036295D94